MADQSLEKSTVQEISQGFEFTHTPERLRFILRTVAGRNEAIALTNLQDLGRSATSLSQLERQEIGNYLKKVSKEISSLSPLLSEQVQTLITKLERNELANLKEFSRGFNDKLLTDSDRETLRDLRVKAILAVDKDVDEARQLRSNLKDPTLPEPTIEEWAAVIETIIGSKFDLLHSKTKGVMYRYFIESADQEARDEFLLRSVLRVISNSHPYPSHATEFIIDHQDKFRDSLKFENCFSDKALSGVALSTIHICLHSIDRLEITNAFKLFSFALKNIGDLKGFIKEESIDLEALLFKTSQYIDSRTAEHVSNAFDNSCYSQAQIESIANNFICTIEEETLRLRNGGPPGNQFLDNLAVFTQITALRNQDEICAKVAESLFHLVKEESWISTIDPMHAYGSFLKSSAKHLGEEKVQTLIDLRTDALEQLAAGIETDRIKSVLCLFSEIDPISDHERKLAKQIKGTLAHPTSKALEKAYRNIIDVKNVRQSLASLGNFNMQQAKTKALAS